MEAVIEEVSKQLDYYVEHNRPRPDQTTVLFDADLKQTKTMRKKEFSADYRYAQEPDIPFVDIESAVEEAYVDGSLLPFPVESVLINGGVLPQDAKFFTSDPVRSNVFLSIDKEINDPKFVARTLTNNLKPEEYHKVSNTQAFTEIFSLLKNEKISEKDYGGWSININSPFFNDSKRRLGITCKKYKSRWSVVFNDFRNSAMEGDDYHGNFWKFIKLVKHLDSERDGKLYFLRYPGL